MCWSQHWEDASSPQLENSGFDKEFLAAKPLGATTVSAQTGTVWGTSSVAGRAPHSGPPGSSPTPSLAHPVPQPQRGARWSRPHRRSSTTSRHLLMLFPLLRMPFPSPLLPLLDQILVFRYLSDLSLLTVLQITDAEMDGPHFGFPQQFISTFHTALWLAVYPSSCSPICWLWEDRNPSSSALIN